jgi:hypothetical protein
MYVVITVSEKHAVSTFRAEVGMYAGMAQRPRFEK